MTVQPTPFVERGSTLRRRDHYFIGQFFAMGCPCEVLVESEDADLANRILVLIRTEAWRIEARWSRYLETSVVQNVNQYPEQTHRLDEETVALIEYAARLWSVSDGAFDITSGVYRTIWTFDVGAPVPTPAQIAHVAETVGWDKTTWRNGELTMRTGMQIDLGGLGKEYAVDACCRKITQHTDVSCLVNFGGDCAVTTVPRNKPWSVGIESAARPGTSFRTIEMVEGALATSGSVHRFVIHDGRRLSHVIDARTGWPIEGGPLTVTVRSESCLEAGSLSTLAHLYGSDAKEFLRNEAEYWLQWS